MPELVCTVTPTIMDGTVVRWYRRRNSDADLSGWATHRRERVFGGGLVPFTRKVVS